MTGLEGISTSLIAYNAGCTAYYLLKITTEVVRIRFDNIGL